jgi:hypothetical protein
MIFSLGACLLASCAQTPPERVQLQGTTKRAWVVERYVVNAASGDLPQCLATLSTPDIAARHFVKVMFKHSRRMLVAIAEVPDSLQARTGDEVEVSLRDCSSGGISQVSRILPADASSGSHS